MRYLLSLFLAALVSAVLFLFMNGMIGSDDVGYVEPPERSSIDFRRHEREEQVQTRSRTLPEEPEPQERPPEPVVSNTTAEPVDRHFEPLETPDFEGVDGGVTTGTPYRNTRTGDGDAVAVVRVEPQWPRRALEEGIEGWVRVSFTIRSDGSVANARVIEAEPARVFNQSALRAIERWQFRPRVVDGRPVERTATQLIEFRLD